MVQMGKLESHIIFACQLHEFLCQNISKQSLEEKIDEFRFNNINLLPLEESKQFKMNLLKLYPKS